MLIYVYIHIHYHPNVTTDLIKQIHYNTQMQSYVSEGTVHQSL